MNKSNRFKDGKINTRFYLSALWASAMFCYIYSGYVQFFVPSHILEMNDGAIRRIGTATPGIMIGVSALMAIPSLMIALSLLLPPATSRWANIVMGGTYTAIILLTVPGSPPFYVFFGVIEVALTLSIIWIAGTWPRRPAGSLFSPALSLPARQGARAPEKGSYDFI